MRDPDFRRQLLSEDPIAESTFPLIERLSYKYMFRFGDPPNYLPREQDSIAAVAVREGRTAPEVAYDVMLEDEGRSFIYSPLNNYAGYDMSASEAMLSNRNVIMGLGDGGAHVGFILDAGFPDLADNLLAERAPDLRSAGSDSAADIRHGRGGRPPGSRRDPGR